MFLPVSFRPCHGLGQDVLLVEDGDGFGGFADAEIESVNWLFILADILAII